MFHAQAQVPTRALYSPLPMPRLATDPAAARAPARGQGHWRAVAVAILPALLALACRRAPPPFPPPVPPLARVERAGAHLTAARPGTRFQVPARGGRLRGELSGGGPCRLAGPAAAEVMLPCGPVPRPIDLSLAPGRWRFEAPPGTLLEEARLVDGDGASGGGRLVVLVVVDTLRDDHLSTPRMPRTLAALRGGRRFTDTRANASWTLPSLASAFTSRPVLELASPEGALIGISPGRTPLAERLRGAGFATAAFVANATLREANGFGRGFQRFVAPPVAAPPTDAAPLLAAASSWIAAHRGEDAFVWLHLMEPHEPLRDHRGDGRAALPGSVVGRRERAPTAAEATTFRALYGEEVEYLDGHLGPFLAALPPDSVVVLTADHGEMLGEGTAWGHGMTVYEPVLRVPLLIRSPGVRAGRDASPAELLDLVPTLLRLLDLTVPAGELAGIDLLGDGRGERVRLAASFGAGVLRWSWARGDRGVVAHFAPQAAPQLARPTAILERHPLDSGIWAHDRRRDPAASGGVPPRGAELAAVVRAFAADVGRLVPGEQVLVAGWPERRLVLRVPGSAQVLQVFATAETVIERRGRRLALAWPHPPALALAVVEGGDSVRPLGPGWASGGDAPPVLQLPGRALWRNRRQPDDQQEQAEIEKSLRALGYL